jgi:RHS repeat-associated protein
MPKALPSHSLPQCVGRIQFFQMGLEMKRANGFGMQAVSALIFGMIGCQAAFGQTVYFVNDVAGSPLVASDANGALLWRESYRPYGERMLKPATANAQWFHGKLTDPDTGLEDFGARNYDPVIGRFLSIDPVDYSDGNIHSFNRYAYGNNNPQKYKDPDGRWAQAIAFTIGFAIDVGVQVALEGKDLNPFSKNGWDISDAALSGAGAALTGNVTAGFARQALKGTMTVTEAGLKSTAVGAAVGFETSIAQDAVNGKPPDGKKAAAAAFGAGLGTAAGAKLSSKAASTITNLERSVDSLGIGEATRSSVNFGTGQALGTSAGQSTGKAAADAVGAGLGKKAEQAANEASKSEE